MAIDREKVLAAAQSFVEKGKYDRAIGEYQKIIQDDPNDARTLLRMGDLHTKLSQYERAIAVYERVGKYYAAQGFALKAIAVFKQIRELVARHVPQLAERYAHITPKLAELYQQLGLTSDALAAYDEVAQRLQRQGRDQEANEVFRKIVELDPSNPLPHLRLAEGLSRIKDADGAVTGFGTAATLLIKLQRRDDALKVLERLLHHRLDSKYAKQAAELYLDRGTNADGMLALPKLQVCFQANPRDFETLALLARAFALIGQPAKGLEVRKEMARVAREQGKSELFAELVGRLRTEAPDDEGVRQLVAALEPPAPPAPAVPDEVSLPAEALEDADVIEEPFELKSQAGPPPQPAAELVDDAPELVAEENVELVDDAVAADIQAQIEQLAADARSFRRVHLYPKATQALQAALELDPRSLELRVLLRDVLLEAGRQDQAVHEMINIASLQVDGLDGEGAAQTLQQVMSLDPHNARAAQILRELGYELVDEKQAAPAPEQAAYGATYDPEAPLPSYDLDESAAQEPATGNFDQVDAPFGSAVEPDVPLPSFPFDAPESEASFDLVAQHSDEPQGLGGPPSPQSPDDSGSAPAEGAAAPPPSMRAGSGEIEEALDEAEFFASRGLYDDARTVLRDQLSRTPNHPLLLERMVEVDAQDQVAKRGSGTRERPTPGEAVQNDAAFDIDGSLDALEHLDVEPEAAHLMNTEQQVDVEEVFAKFKEGVAKQLSDTDGQAHYDLGVAYKEMGLIDDSIGEFTIAAKADDKRACICWSMVGMIQMERGDADAAIAAYEKGLAAPARTPEQETVLSFEIGAAYENKHSSEQALTYYQRVARRDPNYRDVQDRIRKLQKHDVKVPSRAMAVGAEDDEIDRAFDDLIGSAGKTP